MKFCPQCGTTFEQGARFCPECGFDRSTIETVSPAAISYPDVYVPENELDSSTSANVQDFQIQIISGCPQCGTNLDSGERFCAECGFDTTTEKPNVPEIQQEVEKLVVEEINIPIVPVTELVSPPANKIFCQQCGSAIEEVERFCPECGFDTTVIKQFEKDVSSTIPEPVVEENIPPVIPVEQPVSVPVNSQFCPQCGSGIDDSERFCPDCGFDSKDDKTNKYSEPDQAIIPTIAATPSQPEPVTLPPAYEPGRNQTSEPQPIEPPTQPKRKKTVLWLVLVIIAIGVLGAAGWFVYNNYLSSPKLTTTDEPINMGIPVTPVPESNSAEAIEAEVIEQPEAATSVKPNTKPANKIGQGVAKQKEKAQNQPSAQQNKPVQPDETSTEVIENNIPSKVLLEIGRKEEPKNKNPKNPVKLTLQKVTAITRITTDHYNNGMGTPRGGTIMIKDYLGLNIGNYKAIGKTGKNGTPSAKWIAEPNITLAKGTYFISDSDISTWSKTFLGGNGFVVVEGYEVE